MVTIPGGMKGTPTASSVSGSNCTEIGASVMVRKRSPSWTTLMLALSPKSGGANRVWTRLNVDRHGSVANSGYGILPVRSALSQVLPCRKRLP